MPAKALRLILFALGLFAIGVGALGFAGVFTLKSLWWTILVGLSCVTGDTSLIRRSRDPNLRLSNGQPNEES
jgi:hypothetical protein